MPEFVGDGAEAVWDLRVIVRGPGLLPSSILGVPRLIPDLIKYVPLFHGIVVNGLDLLIQFICALHELVNALLLPAVSG